MIASIPVSRASLWFAIVLMYEFLQPDVPVPASGLRRARNSSVSGLVMISSGPALALIRLMILRVSSSSGPVSAGAVMNWDRICSVAALLGVTRGPPTSMLQLLPRQKPCAP